MLDGVKLSLTPNFAVWDFPSDYAKTVPPPSPDYSSIFSRAPFAISEDLFYGALENKWPLILATSYVVGVKTWNYVNRQRGGKPWAFSKTRSFFWLVVLHNVFLAVYSAWTFVGILGGAKRSFLNPFTNPDGLRGTADSMCRIVGSSGLGNAAIYDTTSSPQAWFKSHALSGLSHTTAEAFLPTSSQLGRLWNEGLAFYGFWFYLSKYYEFIDTIIILLKGKQSSTLQTYHHMGACGCLFVGIKYMSPPIWIFLFFNSFIHSLMYTYYTVTAFNIRVPKAIKQTLTTMQITQFLVGGGSAFTYLFVSYKLPLSKILGKADPWIPCLDTSAQAFAVWFNVIYLTPLTYLFARFFVKSYLGSSSSAKKDVKGAAKTAAKAGENAVHAVDSKSSAVHVNGAASQRRANKVVD